MLTALFKYKAWANEELLSQLEKLDPITPPSDHHTAIRIFNHTYVVDRIFAAHLTGETNPYTDTNTPETPSLDALRVAVSLSDQWYMGYAGQMTPELLAKSVPFTFTDGGNGRMTREEMLIHIATHGGYHRCAIGRILAQLSITPPRDIFTAYLHMSEPARREQA